MANKDSYLDFLTEQLAPMGEITRRAMFGGHTLYCDGVVFALVSNNALYLKADDANRGEFEARGLHAFCPFEDRPEAVMQYYEALPEMFEDPDALTRWAGGAITAGQNKKRKQKPRSPR